MTRAEDDEGEMLGYSILKPMPGRAVQSQVVRILRAQVGAGDH